MQRNRRRSPPPRYVPYSPLGRPVRQNPTIEPSPPYKALFPRPDYHHPPWNPHNQGFRPNGGAHGLAYHPPFPRFPTPCELGMGRGDALGSRGKNRKVRFNSSRVHVSRGRGGSSTNVNPSHGDIANQNSFHRNMKSPPNQGQRSKYGPANTIERPRPPPPPPLVGDFAAISGSSKSATSSPMINKPTSQYKVPTSPEEEKLRLAIISAVKELLRGKKLDKKMFKFVCKHCSLNIFSILSEKKDISKPEKMIHLRMGKIKKLVDEECVRVVQSEKALQEEKSEKALQEEKSEKDVLKEKLKSKPSETDNQAELR